MNNRIKALLEDLYRVQSIPKALREEIGCVLQDASPVSSDCGGSDAVMREALLAIRDNAGVYSFAEDPNLRPEVIAAQALSGPARGDAQRCEWGHETVIPSCVKCNPGRP